MKQIKYLIGLLIYRIAPIKKNRYVFTSFNGHYSDNPKAISEKLYEVDKGAEIIWLVLSAHRDSVPSYAKVVDINSLKSYWYRGTAVAQIDNIYGFRALFKTENGFMSQFKLKLQSFLLNKKKQIIFSTMHGTPLKRLGRDQVGNTVLDMFCTNTHLLVGDNFSADVFKRVTFDKLNIAVTGSPRNDILTCGDVIENREQIGLPKEKKILLYAPTFRNDGKDVEGKNVLRSGIEQLSNINFDLLFKTLTDKFGGEWVMVCRFHYHVANLVDWDGLNEKYPGKFVNGNKYDDMATYLSCADLLLTDSSSCMFDFCITKRPCFLYFPDYENYKNKERGFYMDVEQLPFPMAVDCDSLIEIINCFDQSQYELNVDHLTQNIGMIKDGNASERIVKYIFDKCNENI